MFKKNPNVRRKSLRLAPGIPVWVVLLVAVFCGPVFSAHAAEAVNTAGIELQADQQLLADYALRFWQKINQARRAPLAVAARLAIDEATVRSTFGNESWILDQGLPPIAWNEQLQQTASAHGEDMLVRNYYNYNTPENIGPFQRIHASGYQPMQANETINALFFNGFVDFEVAADQLLSRILRDELTGYATGQRNIFSEQFTEVGIAFFAQTASLQPDLPYVYLLVLDFGLPVEPRRYVVIDTVADHRVAMKKFGISGWTYLKPLAPGVNQARVSGMGAVFIAISDAGLGRLGIPFYLTGNKLSGWDNIYIDLSFE
jgi:hypothetical protein